MSVSTRPVIPAERYAERLARAAAATAAHGLDAPARRRRAGPALPDRLPGHAARTADDARDRPSRGAAIVVPRLERGAAEAGLAGPRRDRHLGRRRRIRTPRSSSGSMPATAGRRHGRGLGHAAGRAICSASRARSCRSALRRLRHAGHLDACCASCGWSRTPTRSNCCASRPTLPTGSSPRSRPAGSSGGPKRDVAREVRDRLLAEGHETRRVRDRGSGPNSASPHHEASERVIQAGEPIVLDIGGSLSGYGSDITRTLWVTGGDPAKGPDEAFRHLFGVLHGAQAAATRAVRPGVSCEAIDAAARQPIEAEGYGEAFFHRTGHGIGLEAHEDPYMIAGNAEPLQAGMAFSVEPGIYLVGRYGARIEDIVVCGPDGPDRAQRSAPRAVRRRRLMAKAGIIGRSHAGVRDRNRPGPADDHPPAALRHRHPDRTPPGRAPAP